jgi:hypothetical protein
MGRFCAQIPVRTKSSRSQLCQSALIVGLLGLLTVPMSIAKSQEVVRFSDAPVIEDFAVVHLGGNEWEVTGQVVDSEPAGLTVFFWGAVGGSAVTGEDGSFTFCFIFDPMGGGLIEAEVGNAEGQFGSAAAYISNS